MNHIIKRGIFSIGLALPLVLAVSCKNNDDALLPSFEDKSFTGTNLELYYNGEQMPGKSAKVHIADGKASITFDSSIDLSQISGAGLSGTLTCPGVLPGNLVLDLTSPLQAENGYYSVAGSGETDNVTYKYTGEIYADKMVFKFADCKLKNQIFGSKVFVPTPLKKEGLEYVSSPLHLEWELDPTSNITIPLSDILKGITELPIIPVYNNTAYMSIAQGIESVIKTIALTPSGNLPVMYISTLGGAAHIATTSGNMIQYLPYGNGVKLYLNPLSIYSEFLLAASDNKDDYQFDFAEMLGKRPAETAAAAGSTGELLTPEIKQAILKSLLSALAPQIATGVPMAVTPTQSGAEIYFDTQTSVTFLASIFENLMKDPVIAGALQSQLGNITLPGVTPEQIAQILADLPQYLIKTTKLEIGLSLTNYTK